MYQRLIAPSFRLRPAGTRSHLPCQVHRHCHQRESHMPITATGCIMSWPREDNTGLGGRSSSWLCPDGASPQPLPGPQSRATPRGRRHTAARTPAALLRSWGAQPAAGSRARGKNGRVGRDSPQERRRGGSARHRRSRLLRAAPAASSAGTLVFARKQPRRCRADEEEERGAGPTASAAASARCGGSPANACRGHVTDPAGDGGGVLLRSAHAPCAGPRGASREGSR